MKFNVACRQRAVQQFNGREGETATFFSRCPLNLNGLGGGFAPRHLNRYVALGEITKQILITVFCLGLCGLSFACASKQENVVAASPNQNTPLAQSTVQTTPTPEPTPSLLTEKELKRRAEVHKLMLKGEYLHDGAGELLYIGDIGSVPAFLVVLKKNPPMPSGSMICTAAHALQALRKITGANHGMKYEVV